MRFLGRARLLRAAMPLVLLVCPWGMAQRISGAIAGGPRVTLAASVSPRTAGAVDLGAATGDQQLPLMSIYFAMTAAQQQSLGQLLADQQNPATARYRKWLTPEQFGAQFGLSAADLATVSAWLAAQGFTVSTVSRGGLFVQFSGTVAQANAAFGVQLHNVLVNGEQHVANLSAVSLPAALAAVTSGVAGLDDFKAAARVSGTTVAASSGASAAALKPLYTVASTGTHSLAPGDFYTIYDEKALLTGSITGSGVSIAVVGQTDINATDIAAFQKAAGLASNTVSTTLYGSDPGFTTAADLLVAEQGLEWAGAVAPGATLVYANSINALFGSLPLVIDNNLSAIVIDGYGECEATLQANNLVYYSAFLEQAASQGQTIVAPSGEFGATDCDTTVASAVSGLAVDFPAVSPFVLGVGGTEFNEGSATYWSGTNGTNGGSALSYIPEKVWNDDSSTGLFASGGGASLYFSKPSWQVGTGVPADYARDVPDVSLSASAAHDAYLVCVSGSCTNGFANASGAVSTAGGTSSAAAAFGGLLALVEQKTGARLGVVNPTIYALANSAYAGAVFHDTTTGTNASPCTAGSTGCAGGGTIGFNAATGYDEATGWGSVDAYRMVTDWALVTPVAATGGPAFSYTNVAGSTSSVTQGKAVTLTTTVTSAVSTSTATPTGTVQITVDGAATGTGTTLASGVTTYSLSTTALALGTHTIQATYLGDANYQGSRGAFVLMVTAATTQDFTLTPATSTVTTTAGTVSPGVVLTVTAVNGFTGNVTFAIGAPTTLNLPYTFSLNPVAITSSATTGSTTLSLFAYTLAREKMPARPGVRGWKALGSGVALAGLMLLILPPRRRLGAVLVVLMSVGAVGLSGCIHVPTAAATTSQPVIIPTAAGTYVTTVVASGTVNGATVSHSATVTLVVQ
jgi:subtilase family serine protease